MTTDAAVFPGDKVPPGDAAAVDLLGALAYAQLTGFEELAADAQMTPHLAAKLTFARMAAAMFERCERVGRRLEAHGASAEAAMAPFMTPVDQFHTRTTPSDWLEGIVKAYVGDGIVRDFHLEMARHLSGADRDFVVDMLTSVPDAEAIVAEVRVAIAADERLGGRLSLWARRIMGETMQATQSVAVERDSLTALLLGGEPGSDINEAGRMFARMTQAHTERMGRLGLSA
ncbi:MAG: ferritin-like fold-containing protein [Candidatus Phosphoribacter sp.]|nr:tRNA 2-methylthio-N6-isopentenyl adenosine(37) hydroxylase MiaE-like protein [Actinomycetales bacterium]